MKILDQRPHISQPQRFSGRAISSRTSTQFRSRRIPKPHLARRGFQRHLAVPSNKGIRVETVVNINRPLAEVYSFWRQFENLPRFMRHLESVIVFDSVHSHWKVKGLPGKVLEWDAEIIEEEENRMLSWRSVPEAGVESAGSVWFTPSPGGLGTAIRVVLEYKARRGKAGALIANLFSKDAESEIVKDLKLMKSLLESAEIASILH